MAKQVLIQRFDPHDSYPIVFLSLFVARKLFQIEGNISGIRLVIHSQSCWRANMKHHGHQLQPWMIDLPLSCLPLLRVYNVPIIILKRYVRT